MIAYIYICALHYDNVKTYIWNMYQITYGRDMLGQMNLYVLRTSLFFLRCKQQTVPKWLKPLIISYYQRESHSLQQVTFILRLATVLLIEQLT